MCIRDREEVVARLACAVANQDIETLLATVALFVDEGKDLRQILLQLLEYLREQLLESLKPQGNSQFCLLYTSPSVWERRVSYILGRIFLIYICRR